jgi:hypothetical protein
MEIPAMEILKKSFCATNNEMLHAFEAIVPATDVVDIER